ncbi:flavin reductase [Micromonospora cathayae]|uniref:Flavin reductase n=1 Tax=Micromonospora cathayae TaxID=3028804 RepID=A0ABY7ZHD0_9ACTN|nr:flavin reductase [Micromonospora sp. HUAS 3]WDZ82232.1 flavin reductase [Micromonospora sp. HUAS 3]
MTRAAPHEPMRPLWRCGACRADWPCEPAKLILLHRYRDNRTGLFLHLAHLLVAATPQLTELHRITGTQQNLAERFVYWARPRT